ncbi:hypothetical protein [Nocardioides piscis]|uniref:Type VII secretion-associated protein n=1 Tax=Nocardioides piscis TaxID=2714938 RepID=A0A6G7YEK1_9ACTN|nr:hypothetical protein [Nocardioides piscis]QIK75068.1 hypothetical protein G7071_06140 [Nocardioides piscis]
MEWRGLVGVAVLLAVGIAGGVAVAASVEDDPDTAGDPTPVVAVDPSVPSVPVPLQEDPTTPPMPTRLAMTDVSVGSGKNEFTFPVPVEWQRSEPSSNEVKYKPAGHPANTYVLRVEQVESQDQTIPDIVAAQVDELKRDEEQVDYVQTHDSIRASYVHDGYRRFTITYWLDLSRSGKAEAEIAVTGREVDVPGMEKLVLRVIRGIRNG